jgi:heterodisulfide reductase subunit B
VTKLAYYPGCSLHSTGKEMDESFLATAARLGLEMAEIPGWECCGNTAAHSASKLLANALPANELAKVKSDMNLDAVVVPCAACFSRFMTTIHEMEDAETRTDVEKVVGRAVDTSVRVLNLVDVYYESVGVEELKSRITRSLGGVKIAAYYGCLLTRPPKVTLAEDPEYPTRMDDILKVLGAEPVQWNYKTDCCGASLALCEADIVRDLSRRIIADARACGAEAIACACPLCHVNLDTRQIDMKKADPGWQEMPIYYLSQLVGRALGIPDGELRFKSHLVPVPAFG